MDIVVCRDHYSGMPEWSCSPVKKVVFTENVKYAVSTSCFSISLDLLFVDKIVCFSDIKNNFYSTNIFWE